METAPTLSSEIKASAWLTPFKSTSNLINANAEKIWFWCVSINTNFESQNTKYLIYSKNTNAIVGDHQRSWNMLWPSHFIVSLCYRVYAAILKNNGAKEVEDSDIDCNIWLSIFVVCLSFKSCLFIEGWFQKLIVFYLKQINAYKN